MEQHFQNAEGVVRSGNRRGILEAVTLNGDEISFGLTMTIGEKSPVVHRFSGRVRGDAIEGTVSMLYKPNENPLVLPWRASRAQRTTYFEPAAFDQKSK